MEIDRERLWAKIEAAPDADVEAGLPARRGAVEALARAIDPIGFEPAGHGGPTALHSWHAHQRQAAYDKARKYLAALAAAGWTLTPPKP